MAGERSGRIAPGYIMWLVLDICCFSSFLAHLITELMERAGALSCSREGACRAVNTCRQVRERGGANI